MIDELAVLTVILRLGRLSIFAVGDRWRVIAHDYSCDGDTPTAACQSLHDELLFRLVHRLRDEHGDDGALAYAQAMAGASEGAAQRVWRATANALTRAALEVA